MTTPHRAAADFDSDVTDTGGPAPTRAEPASHPRRPITRWRQALIWILGLIWLLDAALQYQPYMFTKDFPNDAIRPTGQGSPGWVASPVSWSADLMVHHIVFWNAVFATIQLLIALGLFWRRTAKLALAGSFVWAVMIWWLGEGLGGVLAGPVSPVMGLPGAVIIYALIAVFVWPRDPSPWPSVAEASPATVAGAKAVWLLLWASFVFESLRPANRAPGALHDMVTGMAAGEPGWVKSINSWGGHVLAGRGLGFSIALAIIFALAAVSVFLPTTARRVTLLLVVVVALAIWIVGEDFGQIATGNATDPNSGPLLALLAFCFWPLAGPQRNNPTQPENAAATTAS
jgi:hypothetical protein